MIPLFDSLAVLERSLNHHAERQNVLASNLANLNTPGFKSRDLQASEATTQTLGVATSQPGHIAAFTEGQAHGQLVEDNTSPAGRDGNNVSLECEMSKMMASSLRYDTAAEIVSRRLAMLRYAASDGQG